MQLTDFLQNQKKKYNALSKPLKSGVWYTACNIIRRGLSIITLPIFTRLMSTSEYGQYTIFFTWYSIIQLIITLNIQSELFNKGLIEHSEEKDEFTSNQAGLLIVLNLFFLSLYFILTRFIDINIGVSDPLMVIMFMEILGTAILGLWYARQRFEYEYKKITIMTLFVSILTPSIGIMAVISTEHKAEAKIISNASVQIIIAAVLLILFSRKGKIFSNISWWKTSLLLSVPLVPHYLSLVLLNQSDKLMIDYFLDEEKTAIYSVAHSAGLLMTIINNSLNGAFVPWEYRKIKGGHPEDIAKTANALLGIVVAVNLALIWIAPEAIAFMAPLQYHEAIWCVIPIAMSVYFYFVYTLFVNIEIYYGASKYIAIASIIACLLNIILNYIFIPMYGYIAAGYTTLFSYIITMLLHLVFMINILKRNSANHYYYDYRAIVIYSVVLALAGIFAAILYPYSIIRWIILFVLVVVLVFKRNSIIKILKNIKGRS